MKIAVCCIAWSRSAQNFPKLCQTSGKLQLTAMLHSPRKWTQFGIVIVLLCQAAWQFDDAPHFMQRETSSDDVASLVNQIHTHTAFLSWLYWPKSKMPTCCLRGKDVNPNNLHITFKTFAVTCIVSQILCRMKHKCLLNLRLNVQIISTAIRNASKSLSTSMSTQSFSSSHPMWDCQKKECTKTFQLPSQIQIP